MAASYKTTTQKATLCALQREVDATDTSRTYKSTI